MRALTFLEALSSYGIGIQAANEYLTIVRENFDKWIPSILRGIENRINYLGMSSWLK